MVAPLVAAAGIGAASSLLGGYLSGNTAEKNAERNIAMQREFAQQGIRWKVEDAKAAGIHPLAALGAQTTSFAPVSVGSSSLGSGLAAAGQDISRAINATQTAPERRSQVQEAMQAMQLDNMSLQNQILASRLKTMNQAGGNPALPAIGTSTEIPTDTKIEPNARIHLNNTEIRAHPGWSPAEAITNQYGEPAEWAYSPIKMMADFYNHYVATHPDAAANRAVQSRYARARREGYPIGHRHWRE